MPTPVSHIVLTEKIYKKYFSDKNRKNFYIGHCFPDIRRNAGISRKKVHFRNLKIKDIKKESSFLAGFYMHSLIDELTKKFFVENDIYNLCPKGKYQEHSIKIVQDRLYYEQVENWNEFISSLDEILEEQLNFGIDRQIVKNWHLTIQEYLSQKPSEYSIAKLFTRVCYSKEDCDEIYRLIKLIEKDQRIVSRLMKYSDNFENYIN